MPLPPAPTNPWVLNYTGVADGAPIIWTEVTGWTYGTVRYVIWRAEGIQSTCGGGTTWNNISGSEPISGGDFKDTALVYHQWYSYCVASVSLDNNDASNPQVQVGPVTTFVAN